MPHTTARRQRQMCIRDRLASTLNLTYNTARQAAITQEILEVVGGSAV